MPFFYGKILWQRLSQKWPNIANYHKLLTKVSLVEVFLYDRLKCNNNNNNNNNSSSSNNNNNKL